MQIIQRQQHSADSLLGDQVKSRAIDSLTVFCLGVGALTIAIAAVLARNSPLPDAAPLLVFAALFALAENQVAVLPNRASASASFMLAMAAIVAFQGQGPLLGALIVGLAGGLYWPHLRSGDWRKILFNSSNFALSSCAAAAAFTPIVHGSGERASTVLLLASVPAALAFSLVNLLLLGAVVSISTETSYSAVLRELRPRIVQILPFALLGVFMGRLYLDYGAVIIPLFVVPILVARQAFASFLALKDSHQATVRILIGALEAKDPYTAGHAERVADYAVMIGREMRFNTARIERLRFAALMHDVGKLVVPNHLLNKPGKLTAEEFDIVRSHEAVSVEILTRIDFLKPVAPSATSEAHSMSEGADDSARPIEPFIVAVADAYDAMTSTRSYRKALPQEVAFEELRKNAGKQFNAEVVESLIGALTRSGAQHGAGFEEEPHEFAVEPPTVGTGSAGLGDLADAQAADSPAIAQDQASMASSRINEAAKGRELMRENSTEGASR
ncbi:MAG: HD domain-containing protein [Acidimicrobiia bacterium]|nr:HD domain-containing protein [Acidimicrobiia bacterium]